jgi:ribosomal-protein-alanine N-acetyltransferase
LLDLNVDTFRIFVARAADIESISVIQTACGLSPWTVDGYQAEMKRSDAITLVVEDNEGQTVGFITGRVVARTHSPDAEIYNIGTMPQFQNQGAGSKLLRRFIQLCQERDAATVWLEVRASNARAIAFYRAHGFVKSGTRTAFYSDPAEDAEIMYLPLQDRNTQQTRKGA